jgi:hypothetical protein
MMSCGALPLQRSPGIGALTCPVSHSDGLLCNAVATSAASEATAQVERRISMLCERTSWSPGAVRVRASWRPPLRCSFACTMSRVAPQAVLEALVNGKVAPLLGLVCKSSQAVGVRTPPSAGGLA